MFQRIAWGLPPDQTSPPSGGVRSTKGGGFGAGGEPNRIVFGLVTLLWSIPPPELPLPSESVVTKKPNAVAPSAGYARSCASPVLSFFFHSAVKPYGAADPEYRIRPKASWLVSFEGGRANTFASPRT